HRHSPGQQRRGDAAGRVPIRSGQRNRQQRDDRSAQGPAGDDLEEDVRHLVGALVGGADGAGADGRGEHQPAEEPDQSGEEGDDRDEQRRGGEDSNELAHTSPRPKESISRRPGVDSMTEVKGTFSLARVSPARTARMTRRRAGSAVAARIVPMAAPTAFAPMSPSMVAPARSSGAAAAAAPAIAALGAQDTARTWSVRARVASPALSDR